jgi:inosine-uridine nucleoside N-ribohydrolase
MTALVFDTDIGTDIDDTWALAMLLGCPELDLKLVTTATGDTTYRARIVAGMLAAAGRDDVPIGVGVKTALLEGVPPEPQGGFAAEADLDSYRAGVHEDGVAALIECVMGSEEPVTVVAVGPLTNIGAALAREPRIAERAKFIGMHGWIRELGATDGLGQGPSPEYNVVCDVAACRAAFAAGWEKTITPIDTCGQIVLRGELYRQVRDCQTPVIQAMLRNYDEWAQAWPATPESAEVYGDEPNAPYWQQRSTVLFDTVGVYLAYDESLLNIERLEIAVEDDGLTRESSGAPELRVATSWRDRDRFEAHLVERLMASPARLGS